jgi:hypothetical protein
MDPDPDPKPSSYGFGSTTLSSVLDLDPTFQRVDPEPVPNPRSFPKYLLFDRFNYLKCLFLFLNTYQYNSTVR